MPALLNVLFIPAYLTRQDVNFIAIDWSRLASGIDYPLIVARNVPAAANHTAYVSCS